MIFSLSNTEAPFQIPLIENTDVYCFFQVERAIKCDESLWWPAICASLRMKHEVLLLEPNIVNFPAIDSTRRWEASENWSWLSPRALSVISAAYLNSAMNFQEFKTFLKANK